MKKTLAIALISTLAAAALALRLARAQHSDPIQASGARGGVASQP